MNLKELIAASTPGPLHIRRGQILSGQGKFKESKVLVAACSPQRGAQVPNVRESLNALRLAHSYNTLPEVVELLEQIGSANVDVSDTAIIFRNISATEMLKKIYAALKKANTITP